MLNNILFKLLMTWSSIIFLVNYPVACNSVLSFSVTFTGCSTNCYVKIM